MGFFLTHQDAKVSTATKARRLSKKTFALKVRFALVCCLNMFSHLYLIHYIENSA